MSISSSVFRPLRIIFSYGFDFMRIREAPGPLPPKYGVPAGTPGAVSAAPRAENAEGGSCPGTMPERAKAWINLLRVSGKKIYPAIKRTADKAVLFYGVPGQTRTAAPGSGGRYSVHLSYGDAALIYNSHCDSRTRGCGNRVLIILLFSEGVNAGRYIPRIPTWPTYFSSISLNSISVSLG